LPVRPAACDGATRGQLPADAEAADIRAGFDMLHLKYYQPPAGGAKICHRDSAALVLVRAPVRNLDPRSPLRYGTLRVELMTDTVEAAIWTRHRVVDTQH